MLIVKDTKVLKLKFLEFIKPNNKGKNSLTQNPNQYYDVNEYCVKVGFVVSCNDGF